MAIYNLQFTSFNYGEVSSYINAFDSKYYKSASKLQNLMVSPYGALVRRNGSKFIKKLEHGYISRLEAFEDSGNSILMEFYGGVSYGSIRFYLNNEPLMKDGVHYIINTQWLLDSENERLSITYDLCNKKIYIFSPFLAPEVLLYDANYNFTLQSLQFEDGPYEKMNETENTLSLNKLAEVGEEIIVTSVEPIFQVLDSNRLLRIAHNSLWGYGKIKGFLSKTQVSLIVKKPFHDTVATTDYRFGSWGLSVGYPQLATIYNGRLYCAKTIADKVSVWVSSTLDYNNFAPTTLQEEEVEDDNEEMHTVSVDIVTYTNAFTGKVSDGKEIVWLQSNKDSVLIGAKEGIFSIVPLSSESNLSPYNFGVVKLASQKSSSCAISTDMVTCYADIHGYDLYSVEVLQGNVLFLNRVNSNCKHLFNSKIKNIQVIDSPIKTLLVLLENGILLSASFDLSQDSFIYAWYSYKFSGTSKVISMSNSYDAQQSYLYLLIERQHDGVLEYYIETIAFNNMEEICGDVNNNCYLDNYVKRTFYNNTIDNLEHLEGKTVGIISTDKNTYFEEYLVENGKVTINSNYDQPTENTEVYVGYNYHTCYQTPVLNSNSTIPTMGLDKKANNMTLHIVNTMGVSINTGGKLHELSANLSQMGTNYNNIKLDSQWQIEPSISIEQNSPYQLTLSYLSVLVETR